MYWHANQNCLLTLNFMTTRSPASLSSAVTKQICCMHFPSPHIHFIHRKYNRKHQYALQNRIKTLVCKLTYKEDQHNRVELLAGKPTIPPQAVFNKLWHFICLSYSRKLRLFLMLGFFLYRNLGEKKSHFLIVYKHLVLIKVMPSAQMSRTSFPLILLC